MSTEPSSTPPVPPAPPPSLNFEEAFSFLFKRERGWSVLITGGILILFSWLLIPLLVVLGYGVALGRAVANNDPELPHFSISQAVDGLKSLVVLFVYSLPLAIFIIPLAIAGGLEEEPSPEVGFVFVTGFFGGFFLLFVYQLVLTAIQPAIFAIYIAEGTIGSCFSFQKIKGLIKHWRSTYVGAAAIIFGLSQLVGFGFILLIIGIVFTLFYQLAFTSHICGQLARPLLTPQDSAASRLLTG